MDYKDIIQNNFIPVIGLIFVIIAIYKNKSFTKRDRYIYFIMIFLEVIEILAYNQERYLSELAYPTFRRRLCSAIGYTIRPMIIYVFIKSVWKNDKVLPNLLVFIPEIITIIISILSLCTDLVFSYNANNDFIRGPLGYYSGVANVVYLILLIFFIFKTSNLRGVRELLIMSLLVFYLIMSMALELYFSVYTTSRYAICYCTIFSLYALQTFRLNEAMKAEKENSVLKTIINELNETKTNLSKANIEKTNAYNALSEQYLSMHRVDIINDTYEDVKTTDLIKNIRDNTKNKFDGNVQSVMSQTCEPQYRDFINAFVDIKTLESRMQNKNYISVEYKSRFYGWCRAQFLKEDYDASGRLWHVIYGIQVIDNDKRREEMYQLLAQTDQLTGITNRGHGEELVVKAIKEKIYGTFAIIDCDHFKSINDTYGHKIGDVVLQQIAIALKNSCKEDDIVFRLGGDEFAIYSSNTLTLDSLNRLWDEIVKNMSYINIPQLNNRKLEISFGATIFNGENNITFNDLYHLADQAMYESKKHEGNYKTVQ